MSVVSSGVGAAAVVCWRRVVEGAWKREVHGLGGRAEVHGLRLLLYGRRRAEVGWVAWIRVAQAIGGAVLRAGCAAA